MTLVVLSRIVPRSLKNSRLCDAIGIIGSRHLHLSRIHKGNAMITLTKQEALDIVWGETDLKILRTKITDTSRWSIHKKTIFEKDGKLYELEYSQGATEMQDEQPFAYDGDYIDCEEVEAVQVTDDKRIPRKITQRRQHRHRKQHNEQ